MDQFADVDLLYGFNHHEIGFIWSHFAFGICFRAGERQAVLSVFYPHENGTLFQHNKASGSRAYSLRKGLNRLLLSHDNSELRYEFEVSPRRSIPHDVRELGVMLCRVEHFVSKALLEAAYPDADEGFDHDWQPAARPATGPILAKQLLASFIGPGIFSPYIEWINGIPRLEIAVYPPAWEIRGVEMDTCVSVNGELIQLRTLRAAETKDYYRLAHLPDIAYRGVVDLSPYVNVKGELASLDIIWTDRTGREILPWRTAHWLGFGAGPLPSKDNIFRVAGPAPWEFFLFSGATWFTKLVRLYESHQSRPFDRCGPILDWGIGCGRIARFFPTSGSPKLTGVDIDGANITWCKENLPWIDVVEISANPLMPFENETFEIIFGHSVMTHLSEPDQLVWLTELHRVIRPGGLCLLTVLNELSWFIRFFPEGRSPDHLAAFLNSGMADDGVLDVGVDTSKPGYYRNISHTTKYIWEVWNRFFEIVDLIDGFADLQSLVLMRRRITE